MDKNCIKFSSGKSLSFCDLPIKIQHIIIWIKMIWTSDVMVIMTWFLYCTFTSVEIFSAFNHDAGRDWKGGGESWCCRSLLAVYQSPIQWSLQWFKWINNQLLSSAPDVSAVKLYFYTVRLLSNILFLIFKYVT